MLIVPGCDCSEQIVLISSWKICIEHQQRSIVCSQHLSRPASVFRTVVLTDADRNRCSGLSHLFSSALGPVGEELRLPLSVNG